MRAVLGVPVDADGRTCWCTRLQSTAALTKLRNVCDSMCHHDATKRPPLPEVLTRLQALAYPAAVCEKM